MGKKEAIGFSLRHWCRQIKKLIGKREWSGIRWRCPAEDTLTAVCLCFRKWKILFCFGRFGVNAAHGQHYFWIERWFPNSLGQTNSWRFNAATTQSKQEQQSAQVAVNKQVTSCLRFLGFCTAAFLELKFLLGNETYFAFLIVNNIEILPVGVRVVPATICFV